MSDEVTRRRFIGAAGGALALAAGETALAQAAGGASGGKGLKIVAVSCSPRAGKTTAQALRVCLEEAAKAGEGIETELIELAGLKIPAQLAAGIPLEPGEKDDFPTLAPKLSDPAVAGIVIGTPVYFGNMSALCKAFLDRWMTFRKENFALSGKVGGVLAVGGARNGGQELTIASVQTALMCHEMVIVGDGRPTGHFGATLWNSANDDVSGDEFGLSTARNLGRRVAEVALRLRGIA
jgi:multimeric flavodoxin WrbA